MASNVRFYQTNTKRISEIPNRDGNMIFTVDTHVLYMDFNGNRLPYSIQYLADDAERKSMDAKTAMIGYYFVADTCVLWTIHDGEWRQLTPSNVEPIFFADDTSEFPETGDKRTLYADKYALYRWDDASGYYMISNKTIWEDIS